MFRGSMVAIITPMQLDGSIDYEVFEKLIEWHIAERTDGIVVAGTTGESATLSFEEHRELIKKAVEFAKGRIPIIAGTGANSTLEALKLTHWAAEDGAQACLLVTPYYNKPSQEGLYQHYRLIAETVDIPQILYNVPSRCGCDLLPETVARLCEFDNIVAIKEASTLERTETLVQQVGQRLAILTGEDGIAVDCIEKGAVGIISVTANLAPQHIYDMIHVALSGDIEQARKMNDRLAALHQLLFIEGNPVPVKWALAQMQKTTLGIRLPLVPLSDIHHQTLRDALKQAQLL